MQCTCDVNRQSYDCRVASLPECQNAAFVTCSQFQSLNLLQQPCLKKKEKLIKFYYKKKEKFYYKKREKVSYSYGVNFFLLSNNQMNEKFLRILMFSFQIFYSSNYNEYIYL